VTLTVVTIAVATAIAIPLAVLANRVRWLAGPILASTGVLLHHPVAGACSRLLGPVLGLSFKPGRHRPDPLCPARHHA
jgi:osmoprotectant transport system permease protein